MDIDDYVHWHKHFDDLSVSTRDAYRVIQEQLQARQVPHTAIEQIERPEAGVLSAKRLYLEVHRDWMTYHVCFANFGTGFFVSSWLIRELKGAWVYITVPTIIIAMLILQVLTRGIPGIVLAFFLLILNYVIYRIWQDYCHKMTYYRIDSILSFHEAVHRVVVDTVNHIIEAKGLKPLSAEESKPVLHKLMRGA